MYSCDFKTQEFLTFASISKNETLINFFNKGGTDIHSEVGTKVFRIIEKNPDLVITKKDKEKRNKAKTIGFKTLFGSSGVTLAKDFGVSKEEGNMFYDAFLDGYPGMREYFENTKKSALKKGYIEIDKWGGSLYFYPHFNKIQELSKKALSYYPQNYKEFTQEQKKEFKEELYKQQPIVKDLWKEWSILKSELERKSLNYPNKMGA